MGIVLMAWGPFNFEVGAAAYEELAHSAAARWEKHPIIGRRPAAQYLGPDEESVTLRGTIYPTATGAGSATTVDDLLTAAQGSTTYTLMSADGTIVDVYRLERARAVSSEIMPGGAQKIVYDLDFHVHDDGTTGAGSRLAVTDAYLTKQGDMVDAIAYAKYGYTAGSTEAVLAANPGLADMGPVLPANVTINLPTIAPPGPATIPTVDLWS